MRSRQNFNTKLFNKAFGRRGFGLIAVSAAVLLAAGCGGGGGGKVKTLYDAYLALESGMTKQEVLRLVPFEPSQGENTSQVLWVEGEEALGVRFDGGSDVARITFAQWGLSIPAGGRNESRNF